jgi:signal transduction histidine kinase/HAMP domain-containing protein
MLHTIKQKYYAIVVPLLLLFAIGYAEIALFLQEQAESTQRGEAASTLDRDVQIIARTFWEIRLWERDVLAQSHQHADQHFSSLVETMEKRLAQVKLSVVAPTIQEQIDYISFLLSQYQTSINRLSQLRTEQKRNEAGLESNQQTLGSITPASNDLGFLSSLLLLERLQRDYLTLRKTEDYQALVLALDTTEAGLLPSDVTPDGLRSYLRTARDFLERDLSLEADIQVLNGQVTDISTQLTGLFAEISKASAELSASEVKASAQLHSRLRQSLLLSYLLALVILFGIVRVLTRRMVEPLRSVSAVVRKVQQGDIDERFVAREKDEISELGLAVNQMLDTSRENNSRLLAYQEDLENKVEELAASEEQLRKHRSQLSDLVAERTVKLTKTIDQLETEIVHRKRVEWELRIARDAAEAANRAKSDFLANMSHELRTPLNAIIGFTELFAEKYFGDMTPAQEEYLGDVILSSQELLSLINDVLDLSKMETGKLELNLSNVPIRNLLTRSLFMVKEKASKHEIKISTAIKGIPEMILADERRLKQILYNLLSNAVKFTPDGGSVQITAELTDGPPGTTAAPGASPSSGVSARPGEASSSIRYIQVSVKDTGIGIREQDLDRIFKPFEQVDATSTRKYQGAGLGLALSKDMVELHGGRMWAESPGKDRGATLCFIIPATRAEVGQT